MVLSRSSGVWTNGKLLTRVVLRGIEGVERELRVRISGLGVSSNCCHGVRSYETGDRDGGGGDFWSHVNDGDKD